MRNCPIQPALLASGSLWRTLAAILATFLGLCSPWAQAQQSEADQDCNPSGGQSQLNACALGSYQRADIELNRKYAELMSLLSPEEQRKLRTAQRAWIRKRDSTCTQRVPKGDYSMRPMLASDCLERLTHNRTWELEMAKPPRK